MGFDCTLSLYRAEKPPALTVADVALFVRRFAALKVGTDGGFTPSTVKLGSAVDQDDRPTSWFEPTMVAENGGALGVTMEIDWDIQLSATSLSELAEQLSRHQGTIYRAFISLGTATKEVIDLLHRTSSKENERELCLCDLALTLGPVLIGQLGDDAPIQMGWMAFEISGRGYLFPWTIREVVSRVEQCGVLQKVRTLCEETWPCEGRPPSPEGVAFRETMGELWPYPLDEKWGWHWGVWEC